MAHILIAEDEEVINTLIAKNLTMVGHKVCQTFTGTDTLKAINENDFPAIAQGENKRMKNRPHEFFRGQSDKNPASDTTKIEAY